MKVDVLYELVVSGASIAGANKNTWSRYEEVQCTTEQPANRDKAIEWAIATNTKKKGRNKYKKTFQQKEKKRHDNGHDQEKQK